ncbi:Fic family protein, partial [Paramuribaculum intestinale]
TEGRATGIPTIQKTLKDNGSAPATIETDDDRTYFLMTIPCRDGFASKLSEDDFGGNNNWTNRLGQTLGQTSVQVQEAIKQSIITNKEQLGLLLEQMTVEVWNKSKRKEDISKMSEYVINILSLLKENSYSASSLIKILDFGDSKDFKRKLLNPMLSLGYISMLYPDKPTSAKQAYRLTTIGLKLFGS